MINVAVIGAGSMGANHVRIYSEETKVNLVGIVDSDAETAAKIGTKYRVPFYSSIEELLGLQDVHAASVVVPTAMHEQIANDLIDAGVHVMVEKPIADTLEAGERMIARAEAAAVKLMVGHIVRFNPALQMLKEKLNEGELGQIYQIICKRVGPFPSRIRDVGVVIDLAPHDLDVMRFVTGSEPIRVYAEIENQVHTEHEDLIIGVLRFANNIAGQLEINWLTPTKQREIVVLGERGMFRVDDLTQDLYFFENAETEGDLWAGIKTIKGVSEGKMVRYAVPRQEPLKLELQAFIACIENDTDPPVSGRDGLAALRYALALVESGQTNQVISVGS